MLIDWFTVGAQVVNFLILVWLMKLFLYQPVLNAIEKRRKEIAAILAEAEADKIQARREKEEFRNKNDELEQQRAALLEKARVEAAEERRRLIEDARGDAEDLRSRQREALRREHEHLGDDIARLAREEVFAIAEKALADLAGGSMEARIGEVFSGRLRELDRDTREKLATAMDVSPGPIVVHSAFELSEATRKTLENALREVLPAPVSFRTEPGLIGGFEILFGQQKLAWNIESHLEELRRSVEAVLAENNGPCAPGTAEESP